MDESQTRHPDKVTSLVLSHRALSDVSCLAQFKNLEKLDLSLNNLSSLEGLNSCINLKWLSVAQNKLESLKGIEGLVKLTVLNAGKNKLKSMDEVVPLVRLCALVLNDNAISSISGVDHLEKLNTLVLSRNPIRQIGNSLAKAKSITKLSLSHCHLQTIGSSFNSCTGLKELRLAYNDVKSLPAELAHNKKLHTLDLGNNLISNWSDLKVLKSLDSLKNLNLGGNPIAENDKLALKVKKIVPGLSIFNAKPIEKHMKHEKGDRVDRIDGLSVGIATKHKHQEEKMDHVAGKRKKHEFPTHNSESAGKKRKHGLPVDDLERASRPKMMVSHELVENGISSHDGAVEKRKMEEIDVLDDGETPLMELFAADAAGNVDFSRGMDANLIGSLVNLPAKKTKSKKRGKIAAAARVHISSPVVEIGLGGPSMWDG